MFVVYPEAIARLPFSQIWAFMFFTMLFSLGIGSQVKWNFLFGAGGLAGTQRTVPLVGISAIPATPIAFVVAVFDCQLCEITNKIAKLMKH